MVPRHPGSRNAAVKAEFARRLERLRIQKGWNHSELARRATAFLPKPDVGQIRHHTIGRDLIGHYVRGKILPNPVYLDALSKALGTKPEDLIPAMPSMAPMTGDSPAIQMLTLSDGRVSLRVNRTVSMGTAVAIVSLLQKEDA